MLLNPVHETIEIKTPSRTTERAKEASTVRYGRREAEETICDSVALGMCVEKLPHLRLLKCIHWDQAFYGPLDAVKLNMRDGIYIQLTNQTLLNCRPCEIM